MTLLLLGCAPFDSAFDSSGAPLLSERVLEELDAGPARLLLSVEDADLDAEIAAQRDEADLAGDRPELVALRAARWARRAEAIEARLPAGVEVEQRYEHFPLLVLRIEDEVAASRTLAIPGARSLDPDELAYPSLSQSLSIISQPAAEAAGFGGAGTSVAVLDTGADWTVADLGACTAVGTPSTCRVAYAQDFAADDGSRDDNGHGTNVSSIVAAVAPEADVLALDVFTGGGAYSTDIIEALDWVVANRATYGIAAVNMSLGSSGYTAPCSDSFATVVSNTRAAGVSLAVASGNNAYTNAISWPACHAGTVSVGAVYDSNMGAVGWSSCSDSSTAADKVTCFSNSASFLDVLAPGALITAGGYTMGGTSMAAPHVAGALAVLRGADGSSSIDSIEDRLADFGDAVTDSRNGYSFPRIDLAASLADCITSLSATSFSAAAAGESGSIDLVTSSGCAWTVSSDASWLSTDLSSGTDSGRITWTAAANTGSARSAHLSLSGRTISVSQAGDSGPSGSLSINGGATGTATTAVSLSLSASDGAGVSSMCISNSSSCSSWLSYATSSSWTLSSGSGTKTVNAWFKDGYGNVSDVVSDSIVLDSTRPSNGTVSASAGNGQVALSWSGYSDSGSGIASYSVVQATSSTAPSSCSGTAVWTGSGTSATLSGLSNGSTYAWRVCAVDGAGNVSTGATVSATPAPEFTPPTGSIVINGDAAFTATTKVTATLSASDASGVAYACLSNTTSCSSWFTMTSSKSWTMSGSGSKSVYAWFKDVYGNVSASTSDSITIDGTKPSNGTVSASGSDGAMSLSWSGFSDASSGIASYKLVYGTSSPASGCTSGSTAYTGTGTSTTLSGLPNGTSYSVRVCAIDNAGNTSTGATATVTVASEYVPPTGSIVLNGGAAWTNSRTVTVSASASDDTGLASMCFSTSTSCSSWQSYASSATTTISSTAGTRTVYAWFKDVNGNVSAAASDSIGYDATGPSGGSITATAGDGQLDLSWSGISDSTSGLASYTLVYAATSAPSSCSSGTVAYSGSDTSYVLGGLSNGSSYGFRVCGVDVAGNQGSGVSTTGRPAPELDAPTGSIEVNSGASWTNSRSLSVVTTASDATGIARMCATTSTSCSSWTTYSSPATVTASSGDGSKTVRVWLEDSWGNQTSSALTDSISIDSTAPKNGTLSASATSGGATLSWSGFSDASSGLASYKLVYGSSYPSSTCSSGTVAYTGSDSSTSLSLPSGTKVYFRLCAIDALGNTSTGATSYTTPL